MLDRTSTIKYLEFLDRHATGIISKKMVRDEDMRSINLEINLFVQRLEKTTQADERFIRSVAGLKIPFDETRPKHDRSPYYFLFFFMLLGFPLGLLICWIFDSLKRDFLSNRNRRKVRHFRSLLRLLWINRKEYHSK